MLQMLSRISTLYASNLLFWVKFLLLALHILSIIWEEKSNDAKSGDRAGVPMNHVYY